jgi:hypothetical protein
VPISSAFHLTPKVESEGQKKSTVLVFDQVLPQSYHPVWPWLAQDPLVGTAKAQRGLTASQDGIVILGGRSRSGSDVWTLFWTQVGPTRIGLDKWCLYHAAFNSRESFKDLMMKTPCSSSTWMKVLTRSPTSHSTDVVSKPVYAAFCTTLFTSK